MCLGIPARIIAVEEAEALVEMNGVRQKIRMDLMPEARVGQYVLLHAGFAISLLEEEDALETLRLLKEVDAIP